MVVDEATENVKARGKDVVEGMDIMDAGVE